MIRSVIHGCGAYLPEKIITNKDLEQQIDTTHQWIIERTGITQRYVVTNETTADIATKASWNAMEQAGVGADDIDMVILATTTPDAIFPSTATKIQAMLGIKQGAAFDIQAVCSGFIYAMSVADNFIKTGQCKTVLVIGADTLSRIVDWEDRATCILFGDGAGAVILKAEDASTTERGILSTHLFSDGTCQDILYVNGGVATGTIGTIQMSGKEVFKHAVSKMGDSVRQGLETNGLSVDDIDWLIPHQANHRILKTCAEKLGVSPEHVINTVGKHANTSAASIPLALDDALKAGQIKQGQLLALTAIGGGLSWGSCIVRY